MLIDSFWLRSLWSSFRKTLRGDFRPRQSPKTLGFRQGTESLEIRLQVSASAIASISLDIASHTSVIIDSDSNTMAFTASFSQEIGVATSDLPNASVDSVSAKDIDPPNNVFSPTKILISSPWDDAVKNRDFREKYTFRFVSEDLDSTIIDNPSIQADRTDFPTNKIVDDLKVFGAYDANRVSATSKENSGTNPKNSPSISVFISYSEENREFATRLYHRIELDGSSAWIDVFQMISGPKHRQIEEAINSKDVVLLILSEHSIQDDRVWHEINMARKRELSEARTVLFPIALDDSWRYPEKYSVKVSKAVSDNEVLLSKIRENHILDFSDPDRFEVQFERLLNGMKKYFVPDLRSPSE